MKRRPIIFGNWKMNMLQKDAVAFIKEVEAHLDGSEKADFGIAAPYTDLYVCVLKAEKLLVGAQNCHEEAHGAFTGEISIPMLEELGLEYCIVGHSERRQYYNETSEACAMKVKQLLKTGINPILCIGESPEQYALGQTKSFLSDELISSLQGITKDEISKITICYEPIWAIGTGTPAGPVIAGECCTMIRDLIRILFGEAYAEAVRIQYGGSVNATNIKSYLDCPDIDGALIGGASLTPKSFIEIIDAVK